MNLYLVTPDDYGRDMYSGFVVCAKSAQRAKQMVTQDIIHVPESRQTWSAKRIGTPVKLEAEETIILASFNAG